MYNLHNRDIAALFICMNYQEHIFGLYSHRGSVTCNTLYNIALRFYILVSRNGLANMEKLIRRLKLALVCERLLIRIFSTAYLRRISGVVGKKIWVMNTLLCIFV